MFGRQRLGVLSRPNLSQTGDMSNHIPHVGGQVYSWQSPRGIVPPSESDHKPISVIIKSRCLGEGDVATRLAQLRSARVGCAPSAAPDAAPLISV